MNDQKIAFIYCYNDEQLLKQSISYIEALDIPEGYEIEIITIKDAASMAYGYNEGMKQSDAKYKVYLHQDVYIIKKSFIQSIIELFGQDCSLGLLGVAGAKVLPPHAIWWDAEEKYGKVFDSHQGMMQLLAFSEVEQGYEPVEAIDGLLMITQFDIPWREELFNGWHFYDLSQSMEFINKGYKVGIPQQISPWCIHDCGLVNVANGFEEARIKFIETYIKS